MERPTGMAADVVPAALMFCLAVDALHPLFARRPPPSARAWHGCPGASRSKAQKLGAGSRPSGAAVNLRRTPSARSSSNCRVVKACRHGQRCRDYRRRQGSAQGVRAHDPAGQYAGWKALPQQRYHCTERLFWWYRAETSARTRSTCSSVRDQDIRSRISAATSVVFISVTMWSHSKVSSRKSGAELPCRLAMSWSVTYCAAMSTLPAPTSS